MRPIRDLTGQRFGKLLVLEKGTSDYVYYTDETGYKTKRQYINWICKCDCGNIKEVEGRSLKTNKTKSCGCVRREMTRQRGLANKSRNNEERKR